LSRDLALHILLQDLSGPATQEDEGCGREGCGKGNCGSCGTGGGCSTCGSHAGDLQGYFAGLRDKMEQQRTPLL
jgi:hypothetical protein